jgi:hypothetical protein
VSGQFILSFIAEDGRRLSTQTLAADSTYTVSIPFGVHMLELSARLPEPTPPPPREDSPEFCVHVLRWLREVKDLDAVSVEGVSGYGTDWEGDTAGGFWPDQDIGINWTDSSGARQFTEVRGDDFMSLWHWVVGSWPAPAEARGGTDAPA